MGQNGEQVVKSDGTFGISEDAKRVLFDSTNTSCCCDGEPPDPPDGKPCPDVLNFGSIRLPNTAIVKLGYGWSATEAIATRVDNPSTYTGGTIVSTSVYWVTIGATKAGDDAYGTRTVVIKNNDGSAGTQTSDWSAFADDINLLKDGTTYYLGIMIRFSPTTIEADVHLLPYRNNPTTKFYSASGGNVGGIIYSAYSATEIQDWKNEFHPAGFYDFTFTTDRSFLNRDKGITLSTHDASPTLQHDMRMFNFSFELGNGTSDVKTPEGGSLCWRDHHCRKPYHAASGSNAYAQSESSDGLSTLSEPWMYLGSGSKYWGGGRPVQLCFPKNITRTPPEFVRHYYSDVGFSGFRSKQWKIPYVNTGIDGFESHGVGDFEYAHHAASIAVPYDIRATYTAQFTVRPFQFTYDKVSTGGFSYFLPEEVVGFEIGTFVTRLIGCNGIGLRSARSFRFNNNNRQSWTSRFESGRGALGDQAMFAPINTYPHPDEVDQFMTLAQQGETTIKLIYTFDRYQGDSAGHTEWWNIEVIANGVSLGVLNKFSSQAFGYDGFVSGGSTVENRVAFVFTGDNINSLNPRGGPMPPLDFQPFNPTQPNLATNSNQPFNSGILNFSLTHNAEFFDSGFKGDFDPYTPIFDYPAEGQGNVHWNLKKGRTYNFKITDQFQMTEVQGFFANDGMLPNGMSLDEATGTISGTVTGNDSGPIRIHGTDAFDRTYNREFSYRVDDDDDDDDDNPEN